MGELAITNAGHPPTYLLRDGEVSEILLPGNPLGALGEDYGSRTIDLEGNDVVVWLSDGLIEATNSQGEPFGYEDVVGSLEGGRRLRRSGERPPAGCPQETYRRPNRPRTTRRWSSCVT